MDAIKVLKELHEMAKSVDSNRDSVFADERSVAEHDMDEIIDKLLGLDIQKLVVDVSNNHLLNKMPDVQEKTKGVDLMKNKFCSLVDLEINNAECVVFQVKSNARMDLIALGCFKGNEDLIRMTKGRRLEITVWNKDGSSYSYHFGEGSTTLISDNMQKQRRMIRECALLDFGIVCDRSHMSGEFYDKELIESTLHVKSMKDAIRNVELNSGGGMSCNIRVNGQTMEQGISVMNVADWFKERGYKVSFDVDITKGLECGNTSGYCEPIKAPVLERVSLDDKLAGAKNKVNKREKITEITKKQARLITDYMDTVCEKKYLSESGFDFLNESGKYYLREKGKFVGFDYSADYEGFVEEFKDLSECKAWLRNEFEISDIEVWRKEQSGKQKGE